MIKDDCVEKNRLKRFAEDRAYFIWQEKGMPVDSAFEDWQQAQAELSRRLLRCPSIYSAEFSGN